LAKTIKTRYTGKTGIAIGHFGKGHWQHICLEAVNGYNHGQVGPIYRTRVEIMADHENYLKRSWDLKD